MPSPSKSNKERNVIISVAQNVTNENAKKYNYWTRFSPKKGLQYFTIKGNVPVTQEEINSLHPTTDRPGARHNCDTTKQYLN